MTINQNQGDITPPHNHVTKIVSRYLIYLPVSLLLTLYVARTLFTNGLRTFHARDLQGKTDIADATNSCSRSLLSAERRVRAADPEDRQGERSTMIMWTHGGPEITYTNLVDTNQEWWKPLPTSSVASPSTSG